jgi:hypothetical protein
MSDQQDTVGVTSKSDVSSNTPRADEWTATIAKSSTFYISHLYEYVFLFIY